MPKAVAEYAQCIDCYALQSGEEYEHTIRIAHSIRSSSIMLDFAVANMV
ncbi:MAG: hypothetical protein Q8M11_20910 [Sulfuritalea sp.]|nr:hypothetical protein [Sulfuritalea sp.]MDP1981416.1 hypothetical protein [Sulfuritalea sp.]